MTTRVCIDRDGNRWQAAPEDEQLRPSQPRTLRDVCESAASATHGYTSMFTPKDMAEAQRPVLPPMPWDEIRAQATEGTMPMPAHASGIRTVTVEVSLDEWMPDVSTPHDHVTRLQSAVWGAAMDVYEHAERLDEEASCVVDDTRNAREVYRGARVVRARLALLIEAAEAAREALRPLDEEADA